MSKYTIENGYYPADRPSMEIPPEYSQRVSVANRDGGYRWYWFRNPKGGYYADDADYIPDGAIATIKDGKKMWYLDPAKEDKE